MKDDDRTKIPPVEETDQSIQPNDDLNAAPANSLEHDPHFAQGLDYFTGVCEKAPIGVYIIRENQIVYLNSQTAEQFDCDKEDLIGKKLLDIVPEEDLETLQRYLAKAAGSEDSTDACVFRSSGESDDYTWVKLFSFPITMNHQPALLCYQTDITKQKKETENLQIFKAHLEETAELRTNELKQALKKAKRVNDLKDTFLANMGHELRTPIHQISSYSEFGLKKVKNMLENKADVPMETFLKYFNNIHSASKTLFFFISNLFDLSTLESGETKFQFIEADLSQIIQRSANEHHDTFAQNNAVFEMAPPDFPTVAEVDPNWISELLKQLFLNAVKYSPSDKRIKVSFENTELSQFGSVVPAIQVNVSDLGVGIPEDELDLIFEKFTQSSRTADGSGGRGIGLAICSKIAANHNGQIWAANNPQAGATFSFSLPYRQPAPSDIPPKKGFDEAAFDN